MSSVHKSIFLSRKYFVNAMQASLTVVVAYSGGGTVARPAVREPVIPSAARAASAPDDVRTASALPSKLRALEVQGSFHVAIAPESAAVVVRRY